MPKSKPKVLIIGLDGACWELIQNFIKNNRLNNLEVLVKNGSHGNMESCLPHVTFPSWKCYSTGKNPGKLGVYGMVWPDFKNQKIRTNNSTSFKSLEYWDYLGSMGIRVGIIDMPTIYPPKVVNGFIVGDPFAVGENYTYPPELQKEIESKYKYKVIPKFYLTKDKNDLDDAKKVINSRFDIAKDWILDDKVDLLHMTIFFTDTVQHFMWDSEETSDIWEFIDKEIGELTKLINDEWYIFVMSDHGFAKIKSVFHLSTWLINRNYFQIRKNKDFLSDTLFFLDRNGLKFSTIMNIMLKLKMDVVLTKLFPREFLIKIWRKSPGTKGIKLEGMESKIDWTNSLVIPMAPLIYFNPAVYENTSDLEKEKIISKLIDELENVRSPNTGEKIIKKVWRREDLYSGKYVSVAPEIIVQPMKGYEISDILKDKEFVYDDEELKEYHWIATHDLYGIFIAVGKDIKKDYQYDKAKILDIVPTILHIFGVSTPKDIDGKVLKDIFIDTSDLYKKEIGIDEKIRMRIKIGKLKTELRI